MTNPNPASSFKKGQKKVEGSGRKPGQRNIVTKDMKEALLEAASRVGFIREEDLDADGKPTGKAKANSVWNPMGESKPIWSGEDGLVGYLTWASVYQSGHFMSQLGRVMPLQVNQKTETKVSVKYETVEEVRAGLLERGMPLKMIEAMEAAMEPKFETQRLPKPPDQVQ